MPSGLELRAEPKDAEVTVEIIACGSLQLSKLLIAKRNREDLNLASKAS